MIDGGLGYSAIMVASTLARIASIQVDVKSLRIESLQLMGPFPSPSKNNVEGNYLGLTDNRMFCNSNPSGTILPHF